MGKKIMTLDSVAAEICKSTFLGGLKKRDQKRTKMTVKVENHTLMIAKKKQQR